MKTKAALHKLQEIDTTQSKVRERILALQKYADGPAVIQKARDETTALQAELEEWREKQRSAEMESRSLNEKIGESERKLMSGEIACRILSHCT